MKYQYTGPGGSIETEVGEFVADGISENGEFIEVQIGSFGPLKKKVKEFTKKGKVRIIHPIAVSKIIEVYSQDGEFLYRRRSPLKGSSWDIFDALLHAPELPLTKGLAIELVLLEITEKRIKDGKGSWRRRGVSISDKEMAAFHESILFKKSKDFLCFIPFKKGEEFTVSSLAQIAGIKRWKAGRALYVLSKMKTVKKIRKKSNAWVYTR